MPLQELLKIDVFDDLDTQQLNKDVIGEEQAFAPGDYIFQEGDRAQYFYVVLEGALEVFRIIRGQRIPLIIFRAGMTGGEVPLLSGNPHMGTGVALTPLRLFAIPAEHFWCMMGSCASVREKVLRNMSDRLKTLQTLSYQREKLASLGTMTAGLAHELNNPASAARQAARDLSEVLSRFNEISTEMLKYSMFRQFDLNGGFPFQPVVDQIQLDNFQLDMHTRSEREDELAEWLETLALEDAWEIAEPLVSVGFTKEFLEDFIQKIVPEHYANFLRWTQKDVEMRLLSQELNYSTQRISELIRALKSYTYMDQSIEKVPMDIRQGIEDTLMIMHHKLKYRKIEIVRDYTEEIPLIPAFGSELNQVWTNLIDNAIAAIPETQEGEIRFRIYPNQKNKKDLMIEVIDNGEGIPAEVQPHIFEPFFTTKRVGEGTGLGLNTVYRIIVNQHQGRIEVDSQPGHTCFRVCLPLEDYRANIDLPSA